MQGLCVNRLTVTAQVTGGGKTVVDGLCFNIAPGERMALVGQSGSGKTMTAHALLGLLPWNCRATGGILLDGRDIAALAPHRRRAMLGRQLVLVPQGASDCLNPSLTVGSQFVETLHRQGVCGKRQIAAEADRLFDAVGLEPFARLRGYYPRQLSGGMAQRVVLAMAMAAKPLLVVADEPTSGVDTDTADQLVGSMERHFPQAAILLITHSMRVAASCQTLLVLDSGRTAEQGITEEILKNPASGYTERLLAALPENGMHILPESGAVL